MNKWWWTVVFYLLTNAGLAQSFEAEQLALDLSKLSQMKHILSDLYAGYQMLQSGYSEVRGICEQNFNLHQVFLDGLLRVSPAIQSDPRIAAMVSFQSEILATGSSSVSSFAKNKSFTPDEINYLRSVYGNLEQTSDANLRDLLQVITDGVFRMSDDERLRAIEYLFTDTREKWLFLKRFDSSTRLLASQRQTEKNESQTLHELYGIP